MQLQQKQTVQSPPISQFDADIVAREAQGERYGEFDVHSDHPSSESSRPNISLQSHSQHVQHLPGGSLGQEYGVQERLQDWSVKKGMN